jgi:hypothetical protein
MAKRTYIKLMTQTVTASFSYLREPDSGREFSDDKYKTTVLISKADEAGLAVVKQACEAAAKAEWPEGVPAGIRSPIRDGAEKADKNPDLAEFYMVTFKSQKAPALYDAAGKPLDSAVNIFSGDQIRVAGAAGAYIAGGSKGVTLYLNAVQLVEKRAMPSDDSDNPFGAVEGGFVNPEQEFTPVAAEVSDASFNF